MVCKFCGAMMEDDGSEFTLQGGLHYYLCECGASCTVHENGEETSWEKEK